MGINEFAATAAAAFAIPLRRASAGYTARTAPDAISREILLARVDEFEEGAANDADIPAAIGRNLPRILEQNLASMTSSVAMAWFDHLSDLEIEHMAQLYVNSNADAGRAGKLLQVAALRLDAPRLGRLSKYFGYIDVCNAVISCAPLKALAFTASSSIAYAAPSAGAALRKPGTITSFGPPDTGAAAAARGRAPMAAFSPSISKTIEQLYAGFRSMHLDDTGAVAAIYETAAYSGEHLVDVWGMGYYFGSQITGLMQEYAPEWYRGTFAPAVGAPLDYAHSLVLTIFNYYSVPSSSLSRPESSRPGSGHATRKKHGRGIFRRRLSGRQFPLAG